MSEKELPTTFRKLVATRASYKFREIVTIVTEPTPKPGEEEVLVKKQAVAEVVAIGPNALYKPGQAVMYPETGAFSEYKLVKDNRLVPLPELKAEYLPSLLNGNTAAISPDKVGEIKSGETVLITSAAGGTGQIAEMGCDRPVNYKTEDLRVVLKNGYPKGVDVVYETMGGDMFDTCVENLAVHGRLLMIGFIEEYESDKGYIPSSSLSILPSRLLRNSASVRGFYLIQFAEDTVPYVMKQIQYYKEGKLKSFVDLGEKAAAGPFIGLEKIVDAVEHLYSKKSIGKILVDLESKQ